VRVIAIDGPAGSGKSTVARAVAQRLGLDYLDTGAMYRSVAFACLRRGIDPADTEKVGTLAPSLTIEVAGQVTVDGEDATTAIRGPDVTKAVTAVASNPEVRAEMVKRQRQWAEERDGGVVEGRDIGSVVFPDAEVKVYLTASDEERARRRSHEVKADDVSAVAADIARRDHADSTRTASPLHVAEGATVIDTTGRTVDEIVDEVIGMTT
jgi:cytidylate kinase